MKVNGYTIEPGANLVGANLTNAFLRGANLQGADLYEANLQGADLYEANLKGAKLLCADLYGANLTGADLYGANLTGANLQGAILQSADLRGAFLRGADLVNAILQGAILQGAILYGANLTDANLTGANLYDAILQGAILPNMDFTIIVPEGDLIVYKNSSKGIVKLLIPKEAARSNGTTRKCRAEYAKVLEAPMGAHSLYDDRFQYITGQTVYPDKWDSDRWNECSHGIHFFLTRSEAEAY